ncbi:hypothetical protein DFA_07353 [Cavenderia fasciculata]|uniref:Elongin-A n=1 Tax=Cavenderia fasciculata TaxID=261658 RepID=F4PW68_CACFS|nr:uncharacterized protein DFA_07353 [Cavenderia fasciculata]EGG20232.1 hypothetical protein DFA_07353 [Cavenderia fasciculata]|eukprot:XP_004367215.1 hypothetical protein DFA_07353 [Cavenderia fasciculata]
MMMSSQENAEQYESLGLKDLNRLNNDLLLRVVQKCSPNQLMSVENRLASTGRRLDTNELWHKHVIQTFPNSESMNIFGDSWKQLYADLEKKNQERQLKVGMRLREKYDNSNIEKKSKQIKVIDPRARPVPRKFTSSPTTSRTYTSSSSSSSSPRSSSSSSSSYSSSSTSSSSNSNAGIKARLNDAKPSGRLMAKVLKEHKKSGPKPQGNVKVTLFKQ